MVGAATVTGRLPERPAAAGGQMVVTAVDPPWFGPDGTAVSPPGAAPAADPAPGKDQARR
jgi:hypothetical protein